MKEAVNTENVNTENTALYWEYWEKCRGFFDSSLETVKEKWDSFEMPDKDQVIESCQTAFSNTRSSIGDTWTYYTAQSEEPGIDENHENPENQDDLPPLVLASDEESEDWQIQDPSEHKEDLTVAMVTTAQRPFPESRHAFQKDPNYDDNSTLELDFSQLLISNPSGDVTTSVNSAGALPSGDHSNPATMAAGALAVGLGTGAVLFGGMWLLDRAMNRGGKSSQQNDNAINNAEKNKTIKPA